MLISLRYDINYDNYMTSFVCSFDVGKYRSIFIIYEHNTYKLAFDMSKMCDQRCVYLSVLAPDTG